MERFSWEFHSVELLVESLRQMFTNISSILKKQLLQLLLQKEQLLSLQWLMLGDGLRSKIFNLLPEI